MAQRALKLFLAFALLWPVSLGDKIVLPQAAPAREAVSSPWDLYRSLASAVLGTSSEEGRAASLSSRVSPDDPPGLLPLFRPTKPLLAAPKAVHRLAEGESVLGAPPPAAAFAPPSPVRCAHLESKK